MKSFRKKIHEEAAVILQGDSSSGNEILNEYDLQHLPIPVKKWLKKSGATGREKIQTVWLKQKFQMKMKPTQKRWYHANAQQLFFTQQPAFIWAVRLKILPLLNVLGRDKFADGKGEMQMKLNGLVNLGKETGPKMDEGTLQRFLGEIVWFPSAAISPYINWEEVDDFTAKATMNYKGTTGSGTFHFNKDGLLNKFIAMRYMGNTPDAKRYQWVITAKKHEQHNGITIPVKLEATWMLETGPWTWCNIEITGIRYNIKEKWLNLL
jgi:hypothetical protein